MKVAVRACRQKSETPPCLGRDWYDACLARIADLERHAAGREDLQTALAPWCGLCAAVGDALNEDGALR